MDCEIDSIVLRSRDTKESVFDKMLLVDDNEIDSPNFGYRRVLISHYKKDIQCFETGAGYFT